MRRRAVLRRQDSRVRFRDPDLDFAFNALLGCGDLIGGHGPLFWAANQMAKERPSHWCDSFGQLADHATEQLALARGRGERAHHALLACYANRAALQFMDPSGDGFAERWRTMETAFAEAMAAWRAPVSAVEVPFLDSSLPGYLLRHDDAHRPALVVVGGGDTSREDLFCYGGLPAWRRGYNAIMVDLPGQGSTPARGLTFSLDTAPAIARVIDYLLTHTSTTQLAIYGLSGGGYFSCLAVASDPRIDAWVASTPIFDMGAVFAHDLAAASHIPSGLRRLLLRRAGRADRATSVSLRRYAWQFGTPDFVTAAARVMHAAPTVDTARIACPSLFLCGASESPGLQEQARTLTASLTERGVPVELRTFDAASGADAHCQINNLRLAHNVVFDWLDGLFRWNPGDSRAGTPAPAPAHRAPGSAGAGPTEASETAWPAP